MTRSKAFWTTCQRILSQSCLFLWNIDELIPTLSSFVSHSTMFGSVLVECCTIFPSSGTKSFCIFFFAWQVFFVWELCNWKHKILDTHFNLCITSVFVLSSSNLLKGQAFPSFLLPLGPPHHPMGSFVETINKGNSLSQHKYSLFYFLHLVGSIE